MGATLTGAGWLVDEINSSLVRYDEDTQSLVSGDGSRFGIAGNGFNQPSDFPMLSLRSGGPIDWTTRTIPTPYSPTHVLHPSVQYFEDGWRGYRYWMAYTPYPSSDPEYENPCVCASNDGATWTAQGAQPLVESPAGAEYNSDTDIAYDSANDRLVMVFRGGVSGTQRLYVMSSSDGVTWTTPVQIYASAANGTSSSTDIASPSLMWNSTTSKWEILGHNIKDTGSAWPLVKITSSSLLSGWDAVFTTLTFTPLSGRKWWHSQFRRLSSGAYIGLVQDNANTVGGGGNLFAAYSSDGTTFYSRRLENTSVVGPSSDAWYRPSFALRYDVQTGGWVIDAFGSRLTTSGILTQTMRLDAATFQSDRLSEIGALLNAGALGNVTGILHADSFNRTNDAAGLGTASGGGTYTQPGGPIDVLGISTNRAYNVTTGNCRAVLDMAVADYCARVTIVSKNSNQWLIVRYIDANNFVRLGHSGGVLTLQRITGGGANTLLTAVVTPAVGDELMAECAGSQIRIFLSGRYYGKVIEGQGELTGTFVGMQMSGTTTHFDNFIATSLA